MASGEDDMSPSGAGRSPGFIPALAFVVVVILALVVFLVLRQLLPPPGSAPVAPTVTASSGAAVPSATGAPALPATATALPVTVAPAPSATRPAATALPLTTSTVGLAPATPAQPAVTLVPTLGASGSPIAPSPAATSPAGRAPAAPVGEVLPPAALGVPPVVYSFYDWQNTDFGSKGLSTGSLAVFAWSTLHSAPNTYDWSAIDSYLAKAASMTITLQNGTVISKPIIIEVIENESETPSKQITHVVGSDTQSARFLYHDYTPEFVRRQIAGTLSRPITYTLADGSRSVLTNDGGSYLADVAPGSGCVTRTVAIVPKYDNATWQQAYKQFVAALGARYDKNPQIVALVFGPGIDQEYGQATKDYQGCLLKAQVYKTMPEASYLNSAVLAGPGNDLSDAWRAAFPSKPLFFQFTSTGKDRIQTFVDAAYQPAIGLKQATLVVDSNNQWQSNNRGTWQIMSAYSSTLPIAWENAYPNTGSGAASLQTRYFTILAGLSTFPDFIDVNGWVNELSGDASWLLDFTNTYLGRSITTTDEVWVAMRGTEYITPTTGSVGYAGWNDDATYGLRRTSQAPLVRRAQLQASPFNLSAATLDHPFALMARRTDVSKGINSIGLAIDHRWPFWKKTPRSVDPGGVWYDITVKYLDAGNDTFTLSYQDMSGATKSQTFAKSGSGSWLTSTIVITDAYLSGGMAGGADIVLQAGGSDEALHMVSIKGHATAPSTSLTGDPTSGRDDWLAQQRAAEKQATMVARLPGVLPTPTLSHVLWLPLSEPRAGASAAAASPTVAAEIVPPGRPTIPPLYYAFYDWQNVDFGQRFPDFPPIGSQPVFGWEDLHVGPGLYDWTLIDSYLRAAASMTVTLLDGSVISKPLILEIVENESEVYTTQYSHDPNYANRVDPWAARMVFHDYTPGFVKSAIAGPLIRPITYSTTSGQISTLTTDGGSYLVDILPGTGACITRTVAIVPKYNNATWQMYYKQFVQALGARYNNHPQIVAVVSGPGMDQEFGQATKAFFECGTNANPYMTDASYWDAVVRAGTSGDILDTFRTAFPSKPVLLQFTGSGKDRAEIAMQSGYSFPVGMKQATLTHDNNNQYQTNNVGTLQLMDRYSQTTYIAWENAYAYNGPNPNGRQIRYFTFLAGLMSFPDYMDFIGGWMIDWDLLDSGILHWVQPYLGRTITNTEDIWVAMRDTDYWPPVGGAIMYGGWHDDFTYGLHRLGASAGITNPIIKRDSMAAAPYSVPTTTTSFIYSLIARRTDNASGNSQMAFSADPRWGYFNQPAASQVGVGGAWYDLTVKHIDLGTDTISLSYMSAGGVTKTLTINKLNTRSWVTTTLVVDDAVFNHALANGADLILSSDPQNGGGDEIVHMVDIKGHRTAGPTPVPTWSPTPKPTRTPTRTTIPGVSTPTRTATPSGSQTPTATPGPFTELRVNAGDGAYVDSTGNTWVPDQAYDGSWGYLQEGLGGVFSSLITVTGTSDPTLYQTERYFAKPAGGYVFSLPNGQYEVELRFAEIFGRDPGRRVFNVDLEGTIVLANLDIASNVGLNVALNRTYQVNVTDGQLNLTLTPITDSAKINALRVTRVDAGAPTATATPTGPTATPSHTRTATATGTRTATASPTPTIDPGAATATATASATSAPATATRTATASASPPATFTRTATPTVVGGQTATPTPSTSLDGRIDALQQRYLGLYGLVTRLLQILSTFGGIQ